MPGRRGLRVTYTKCKEDDKMARHIVIGTAGHVDHGKTTLVRALTGIETDTTAEEKKRGLTINLGFAWLDLPDGTRAGIVDVPGHEKFIKNMVAGLPGLNLVLLVVDANEGVMPQTKEHLDILTLLGVHRFIIVVTKPIPSMKPCSAWPCRISARTWPIRQRKTRYRRH